VITPLGANTYTISGNTFTLVPTTTASYTVTGTGSNGCVSGPAVLNVTVNTTPTITVNNATICSGASVVITPSGTDNYTITGTTFTVSPGVTTSYTVAGFSNAGCSAEEVVATVVVNITPTLSVNNTVICAGASAIIVPSGADTYTISGGSYTVTPAVTTDYTLTGTSVDGCAASNTAVATVSVNTNPTLTVNSGQVCSGSEFTITPSGAATYTISGGSFTVSPAGNTSYSVTGTDANGCVSAEVVSSVTVNALPTVTASAISTVICIGETTSLTAGGAISYNWSTAETGSVIVITPTAHVSYTVTGTDANGCTNTATVDMSTDLCTGIAATERANTTFKAYPNPNTGLFTVETVQGITIRVINLVGQEVCSHVSTGTVTQVNIAHLSNGIYFIKADGQPQIIKIVKE
jgi:hypothetical protein